MSSPLAAIDTHAHVFRRGLPAIPEARYVPESDARLADWLALMHANAISHGVLVQVSFLGTDNSHLLEALDAARGRLRATVQCEPDTPSSTLDDWHRRGVRGVRLNTIGARARPDLSGTAWRAFLARLADRGWHLELHDEGEGLATLLAALEGCPARIVVDHFGYPGQPTGYAAMLRCAERQAVFVKLSAAYRLGGADPVRWASDLLAKLGPGRLMWGSDWPHTRHEGRHDYAALRREMATWVPDASSRRTILRDTPAALFGFDTASVDATAIGLP